MKKEYIKEIDKLLQQCDDIGMLDLIHKLLVKSYQNTNGLPKGCHAN